MSALANDVSDLLWAYPDFLEAIDGNVLVWKDGTRMPISDGNEQKTEAQKIEQSDIKDMFSQAYVPGAPATTPAKDYDPGRARNSALFEKMYGNCLRTNISANFVDVTWLPNKIGSKIRFSKLNGAADQLQRVSQELDRLPNDYLKYLAGLGGSFSCRPIAGTGRLSAHGYGIALDISTKYSHYWQWSKPISGEPVAYQNVIPFAIIEIFERHGFIWGGKWYHFDTMHFEYRPELFGTHQRAAGPPPEHAP